MEPSKQTDKQQTVWEILLFAVMQLICLGIMFGIAAAVHKLGTVFLLGGIVGVCLAVLNYFLMAVGVYAAASKAEQGDVKGGQRIISLSMLGRYALMAVVLVVLAKAGACNVIAMVVPLVLSRILIFVGEFFRRKDG